MFSIQHKVCLKRQIRYARLFPPPATKRSAIITLTSSHQAICYRWRFGAEAGGLRAIRARQKLARRLSKANATTRAEKGAERRYVSLDEVSESEREPGEDPTSADPEIPAARDAEEARRPTMREVFGPGGLLERCMIGGYEHRAAQLQMAEAVQDAFENKHHAVVEAGTG